LMNKTEDEAYNLIFNGPPSEANTNGLEERLKLMCLLYFLLK